MVAAWRALVAWLEDRRARARFRRRHRREAARLRASDRKMRRAARWR